MFSSLNKFRQQLFAKLLLIFFLTGILLIILLATTTHLINRDTDNPLKRFTGNIFQYSKYLIADIGQPPVQEKIDQISNDTGLSIIIEGENNTWNSHGVDISLLSHMTFEPLDHDSNSAIAHRHRIAVFKTIENDLQYYFILQHRHLGDNWLSLMLLYLGIIILVITGAYLAVRRLFRPIKELQSASKEIAEGRLDTKVNQKSNDELGELSHNFNEMVDNINILIQSKEQLLLDVSHELRSPLTRLKLASEMLEKDPTVENIRKDIVILENLISEILESARLRSLKNEEKEKVDLCQLISEIENLFSNKSPGIHFNKSQQSIYVFGSASQLEIALRNIIENALKFSGQQEKPVDIFLEKFDDNIKICICDYGPGIPQNDAEKVFAPFTRLDMARSHNKPGFGLGLNIAKAVIENHQGQIKIEQNSPRGTKFIILLPA